MDVQPATLEHVEDGLAQQAHVPRTDQRVDAPVLQARQHRADRSRIGPSSPCGSITAVSMPAPRARSSERTPWRSDRTSAMWGRMTGSSRSACRFVPEPETSTAMRASIGSDAITRPKPQGSRRKLRRCRRKSARRRARSAARPIPRDSRSGRATCAGDRSASSAPFRFGAACWVRNVCRRCSGTTSPRRPLRDPGDGSGRPRIGSPARSLAVAALATLAPVDAVQHRVGVRRGMGDRCALVDARRVRGGDRPRPLGGVRPPTVGGADGGDRRRNGRRRGLAVRRPEPAAVHQAGRSLRGSRCVAGAGAAIAGAYARSRSAAPHV